MRNSRLFDRSLCALRFLWGKSEEVSIPYLDLGILWRYYLRHEPYEAIAHVGIWAGGAGQPALRRQPPSFVKDGSRVN
jgi:hypothetical protein